MNTLITKLKTLIAPLFAQVKGDTALQNSLYLISSTGVMAVSGLVFWFVSARLYTPTDIGLSSTLVAAATTLALFSLLGFDNVLVRYLPNSKKPHAVIDTSLIITSLAALALSIGFVFALGIISPSLQSVMASPIHRLLFIVGMVLVTINTLTDSIFISFRSAKYILIADAGLSVGKIILPLVLVSYGAYGLFIAYAISVTLATIISMVYLGTRFQYWFKPAIDTSTLREVRKFSAGTYTSNLVAAIPMMAMPIVVTNLLGGEQAAFFNLAMTISAMLFIIPRSTANSLFAEISKNSRTISAQTYRTAKQTGILLLPLTVILYLAAPVLLSIFGSSFATGATAPLHILALSAFGLALNTIAQTLLKSSHKLMPLFLIQLAGTVIMIALCWPLALAFGAAGAAWSWLIGQYVMAGLHLIVVMPLIRRQEISKSTSGIASARIAGGLS